METPVAACEQSPLILSSFSFIQPACRACRVHLGSITQIKEGEARLQLCIAETRHQEHRRRSHATDTNAITAYT